MSALQQVLEDVQGLGATLVAVSPELPRVAKATIEKNSLTFDVLSDEGNRVARKFGLVFDVPADLQEFYKTIGINLSAHNGPGAGQLPLPATFVIDREGIIRAAFADADYVKRMEPADIVATLRTIAA